MRLRQLIGLLALLIFAAASGQPVVGRTLAEKILSDQYSPTDEFATREDIMAAVADSLWNRRFAELEKMAEVFRSQKSRTPSGLWRLSYFYSGLKRFQEKMPRDPDPQIDAWIKAYPTSAAAHVGYASMLLAKAWELRGKGYASTVESENWEPFRDTVERARDYLMQHKSLAAGDPHWYAAMAEVATLQGWSDSDYDALLREAFDREPLYYETYFEATNRNLPKWGGSDERVEAFAREAVARTRTIEGSALYARVYWSASGSGYRDSLFEESRVDWEEMKRGIDDVLARYPNDWNLNHFAKFACLAGDYAKASELIDRIKGEPLPSVWGSFWYLERCRLWAMLTAE